MHVLVVGAHGQIGRHLIHFLGRSEKHSVRAMVRKQEQAEALQKAGAETVVADLEGDVKQIAKAAAGCEAIVFTAGSGAHTGADKTILVDLDGAVKTIEAAQQIGSKRFIMVSALHADKREQWPDAIRYYYAAKHYADKVLEASDLNYTIIRPGILLNQPGTGLVSAAEDLPGGGNSARRCGENHRGGSR